MPNQVKVDVSHCPSSHSFWNRAGRAVWGVMWLFLFRPSPKVCHFWRRLLLRLFGANIGRGARIHPSVRIWAPWRLDMAPYSCLGHTVDCYCVDKVTIGVHSTVSQGSFLCTASHDHEDPRLGLVAAPIVIGDGAWIAADVFVGPGVKIGDGGVVGARAVVTRDVQPWKIVAGNPARVIGVRRLRASVEEGSQDGFH